MAYRVKKRGEKEDAARTDNLSVRAASSFPLLIRSRQGVYDCIYVALAKARTVRTADRR